MKSQFVARTLELTGLRGALAALDPSPGIIGLNYHRVGDGSESSLDRGLWSTSAQSFDEQIAWLKLNADVISPSDIDDVRQSRKGRHVLITFDDGYLDNYQIAYPVLKRHGIPATFFVATGFIDNPRLPWWDEIAHLVRTSSSSHIDLSPWFDAPLSLDDQQRESTIHVLLTAYKLLPAHDTTPFLAQLRISAGDRERGLGKRLWMNWDMLREMDANGMTIGGHTVNHVILSSGQADEQWAEISNCAVRIKEEIGRPMEYFAYPVGAQSSFNADSKACLKQIGVRYAFSYYGGFAAAESNTDPYDMPRMAIEPYVDRSWFRAMIELPRLFCRVRGTAGNDRPAVNEIGA